MSDKKISKTKLKIKEELVEAKLKKLEQLEIERERKYSLPHLYGMKFYPWMRSYYESENKICLINAANQIGKSSIQIRKCITWATSPELWPKLWKTTPRVFWYFYPTQLVCDTEFFKKWVPEWLPRGRMEKDDPVFGWEIEKERGLIAAINFKSGVTVQFKSYSSDLTNLQSTTVHATFCFVAGTLVHTKRGQIPIESVKIGDLVMTHIGWRPVLSVMQRVEAKTATLTIKNGTSLCGTYEHPIWVEGHGWKKLIDLLPGEPLVSSFSCALATKKSSLVVMRVQPDTETCKEVFNLEVAGSHTFFANNILTHNCDEEFDASYLPEIQSRMYGTDGYFSAVMTPTMGQEFWREALEEEPPRRKFPDSFRVNVSMFDCLFYEDGTPSHWTEERIKRIIAACKSEAEVQRRVYGKFVVDEGLKFPSFDSSKNVIEPFKIPDDFFCYIGVDMGSGGDTGHPASVCITMVSPDFKKIYVVGGKRFDGISTVSSDIVDYVIAKKKEIHQEIVGVFYDFHAVDLKNIAISMGESWIQAEKSHAIGEHVIGTAFKNFKLSIFRLPELEPLVRELKTLRANTSKRIANDDFCFVAGTKIETEYGERNIEDIKIGDLVWTRNGLRKVIDTGNREESTVELSFSDGSKTIATPDHPYWTKEGYKKCSLLTRYDILTTFKKCISHQNRFEWEKQSVLNIKELYLGDIQNHKSARTKIITGPTAHTLKKESSTSIKKFGKISTASSPQNIISITSTAIRSIIQLLICKQFRPQNIFQSILNIYLATIKNIKKRHWSTFLTLESLQKSGMAHQRGFDGTKSTLGKFLTPSQLSSLFALSAAKNTTQRQLKLKKVNSVEARVEPESLGKDVVCLSVRNCGKNRVYNLTVEIDHEYFANGILVSNCDSMRYSLTKIPIDWSDVGTIKPSVNRPQTALEYELQERRKLVLPDQNDWSEDYSLEGYFQEWSTYYE